MWLEFRAINGIFRNPRLAIVGTIPSPATKEGRKLWPWLECSWEEMGKRHISTLFISYPTLDSCWCLTLTKAREPEEPIDAIPESAFQRRKQKRVIHEDK